MLAYVDFLSFCVKLLASNPVVQSQKCFGVTDTRHKRCLGHFSRSKMSRNVLAERFYAELSSIISSDTF